MKQERVVLVSGEVEEVAPVRLALEASGIFAVTCLDPEATLAEGFVADLEVVCYSPSHQRSNLGVHGGGYLGPTDNGDEKSDAFAKIARVARHPVPVIIVHEAPSIWDVNYLRSCGAFYVLDRRIEEANAWQGLRDTAECALAGDLRCAVCNRGLAPRGTYLKGAGRVAVCQDCVLVCARDLLRFGLLGSSQAQ